MVEKPVTPTVKEAEELAALAKSKGLVFCVYQNRRWDADFLTLQDLLKSGKVSSWRNHVLCSTRLTSSLAPSMR